jgi:hypothetical protein
MVATPNPSPLNPLDPAPKGKNYWVSYYDYSFVGWYAKFPDKYVEPRDYLDFLKEVLAAAEQEEVLSVVKTSLSSTYHEYYPEKYWQYQFQQGGQTYNQYLEEAFVSTGRIIAFEQLPLSSNSWPYGSTRLSYYETDGQIVEAEIEDIGALLLRLRPNEFPDDFSEGERYSHEDAQNTYKAHGSAIYFSGQKGSSVIKWTQLEAWKEIPEEIRDPEEEPVANAAYFGINLYTDIWFPWVRGLMEWTTTGKYPGKLKYFDNRELAFRHTPQLNRFLQSVKQSIEARGGHLISDCSDFYHSYGAMCSEDGILLDVELADVVAHLERNRPFQ